MKYQEAWEKVNKAFGKAPEFLALELRTHKHSNCDAITTWKIYRADIGHSEEFFELQDAMASFEKKIKEAAKFPKIEI